MLIGKRHTDQFDCGICDVEAQSLENLNIHLSTCEMYQCELCEIRLATLTEIKTHIKTKHSESKDIIDVIHLKQNRIDSEIMRLMKNHLDK